MNPEATDAQEAADNAAGPQGDAQGPAQGAEATEQKPTETPEGSKTLTPEELLEQNRKKNSENQSLRKTNKDLAKQLEEFNAWKESQKPEEQRQKEAHDALVAENAALKSQIMRSTLQAELGLPSEIVELLQGNDEEELRAHAEKLRPLFAPKEPAAPAAKPTPLVNPGQKVTTGVVDPKARDAASLFAHILN